MGLIGYRVFNGLFIFNFLMVILVVLNLKVLCISKYLGKKNRGITISLIFRDKKGVL